MRKGKDLVQRWQNLQYTTEEELTVKPFLLYLHIVCNVLSRHSLVHKNMYTYVYALCMFTKMFKLTVV